MNHEHILLIDDDRAITGALSALLERAGRTTFVCADVESAEAVLARHRITHIVTDVQFTGSFGFEGLHFLSRTRLQHPRCRIVLMTGHATDELRAAVTALGAAALLAKPFAIGDLEHALASAPARHNAAPYRVIEVASIDDVLHDGLLSVAFQPIVSMKNGVPMAFGFEALTRIRGWWADGGPAALFDYAQRLHRLVDLNLAAINTAFAEAGQLPADTMLFVNVDPVVFDQRNAARIIRTSAARHGFPLSRLVLEITERSDFGDAAAAALAFDELRAQGVRFALDDHGSAYSHLGAVDRIQPSFIKISRSFGTDFERDAMRTRIVRHVAALARDLGCRTVLEGVESAATANAAAEQGVELLQGYLLGNPRAASYWSDASPAAA